MKNILLGLVIVLLLVATTLANPPAKFSVGELVEIKENSVRLLVVDRRWSDGFNDWHYYLSYHRKVNHLGVWSEEELKQVK